MAATTVSATYNTWLAEHGLLDAGTDLAGVTLHVGGPPTWYLKLVKKSAITLGSHIWFVREEKRDDIALLAHELVHVGQYRELGVPRFLLRYGLHMLKAGFKYSRTLPLEAPAYARQALARKVLAEHGPPAAARVDS
ncbi:MAG: DUF4157 domain-containing protein [Dehalococcoidia bacterium]